MKHLKTYIVILIIIILGISGWLIYRSYSQSNTNMQTKGVNDDSAVRQVAESYCQNQKGSSGNPYSFVMGTTGPDGKQILYSSDKLFASINVHCAPASEAGGGIGYILKKINGKWTVVSTGTQPSAEDAKKYDIPTVFN